MAINFQAPEETPSDLPFHEAAAVFDLLDGSPFDELVADIKAHGLKLPIVLHDGRILDGRNRYRACIAAGVEPTFRQWDGQGSPTEFVWSLNNIRRHLDGNAKALAAGRYAVSLEAEARARRAGNLKKGAVSPKASNEDIGKMGRSAVRAAAGSGVSKPTVDRAVKIVKGGTPELQKAVADERVSVSAAAQIAAFPAEKQDQIIASADPVAALKGETAKVKAFRDKLPKPAEAERLARENGGVVLGSDGKLHSGATPAEREATDAFLEVFNIAADFAEPRVSAAIVAATCPTDTVVQFSGLLRGAVAHLSSIKEALDAAISR